MRGMKKLILLLFFVLTGCGGGFTTQSDTSGAGVSGAGSIQLFFSQPDAADASLYINGPEEYLIDAIDSASNSVDMAIYELSLRNVTESLVKAHHRGVQVRVLTDSDNLDWDRMVELKAAGIAVKGDGRTALMHNKFTVIDNREVWTGSMNLTYYGAYRNRENLLRVASTSAASNYSEEFSQLWAGIHNQDNAADNYLNISGTLIDVHFSPDDNFRQTRLIPLLQQATQSVKMLAFSFTSADIADELVKLEQQGVDVSIVLDSSQSGQSSSQYDDLQALGMDVRRDGQSFKLHHKVIIIDGRYVVTGSYNFSESAESRNDENSLVIDSSAIAHSFEQEFADIYSRSMSKPAFKMLVDVVDY